MVRVCIGAAAVYMDVEIRSRVTLLARILSREFNGGEIEW